LYAVARKFEQCGDDIWEYGLRSGGSFQHNKRPLIWQ
jgi:hypothetical protein